MKPLAEGVWTDSAPLTILGMPLSSTMTTIRTADGRLLLHSPVRMTADRRAAVEALGEVAHLYAPNSFHHLHVGEWSAAFPEARVHAPAGLAEKRPDLRIDRVHGTALDPDLAAVLDEVPVDGFRLEESVLLCREARTLVIADLAQNVGRPEHPWAQLYTRAMGFYDRVALSRMIRWIGFTDRAAARRSLDGILALPFECLVFGHGEPLASGGREALAAACEWLPSAG